MAENLRTVSKNVLRDEVKGVLKALVDAAKSGTRTRLSEAGNLVGKSLTLDFVDYFKFLRRYNYVAIDRTDQALAVTEEGRIIVEEGANEEFDRDLKQHFGKVVEEADEPLIDMSEDPEEVVAPPFPPDPVTPPPPPSTASRPAIKAVEPRPEFKPVGSKESREPKEPKEPKEPVGKEPNKEKEGVPFPAGGKSEPRYVRYEAIGSGGIGTVYKARHSAFALDLAIKEIKDLFAFFNFLQRSEVIRHFREVVSQMAILNHPLIVKILDQSVEVAHPFFVMEYLPGGNLKDLVAKGPLPIERALICFTQVCYAVQAAHKASVVHGNIKLENVLFDAQGNVRITDFGITRLLQTTADRPVPQVITGALGYLSPEQMRPGTELKPTSDIYSLGILFYEMLTGNLPGRRSPLPSEVNKEIPKDIDNLFDRMTRDKPEDRYPDIDALLTEFYSYFKDGRYLKSGRMVLYSQAPKQE